VHSSYRDMPKPAVFVCRPFIRSRIFTNDLALSVRRTAKNLVPSADDKVTLYQDKFKHLKEAFLGYAILQTEIIVIRVLDVAKDVGKCFFHRSSYISEAAYLLVAAAIDLNDIPYLKGVEFSETPRCLPGTREGILERIQALLSGTADEEIPRIVLLTGVTGHGKSAVASTIAERLCERKRLGSSFFNRNEADKSRVDNVFTNIARDVADENPEIREILCSTIKNSWRLRMTTDVREQFIRLILDPAKQVTTIGQCSSSEYVAHMGEKRDLV
jgi:hypothetical protein